MTGPLINASASVADNAGLLGVLLAHWANRDESKDDDAALRAGRSAVGVIDDMLRTLYEARSVLIIEIRQGENGTAARVDALLSEPNRGGYL